MFRSTHVHNIYLQLICETGFLGAIFFYGFFSSQIIRTIKLIRIQRGLKLSYAKLSLYMQLYFLFIGLTDNPLYDVNIVIFYFLAIGINNCLSSSIALEKVGC